MVTREKDQYLFEDSSLKAFCTCSGDCSGKIQRSSQNKDRIAQWGNEQYDTHV